MSDKQRIEKLIQEIKCCNRQYRHNTDSHPGYVIGLDYDDVMRLLGEFKAEQASGAVPVAWTLQWPSDRKYGTVNYMTTFCSLEYAEGYADQAGRDHRGNKDKDVTVVPLYTQPQPPKAVPKKLTVSQCVSSQYCQGYNDAIDAMLKGQEGKS